jgi:hypothetical protein
VAVVDNSRARLPVLAVPPEGSVDLVFWGECGDAAGGSLCAVAGADGASGWCGPFRCQKG